uniref:Putative conserved secreted protein n=1 Tax=Ixodes ricinus TaxID=34613 RepID=A0A6B0ULP3_IXORI
MPKTGRLFLMTGNQRMVTVLLVLFLHSLHITSAGDPIIKGNFDNLAPDCEEKVKNMIKGIPDVTEATLRLRECGFDYAWETSRGKRRGWYGLPLGFPCAFGSTCDDNGKCKCSSCS